MQTFLFLSEQDQIRNPVP